ncbi:MAG: hypothetical protein AB1801_03305 [Chloroflexota bacterium]
MTVQTLFQTVFTYKPQQSAMFNRAVQLFIKALIIGILVNMSLRYATLAPDASDKNASQYEHLEQRQSLEQSPRETNLNFPAPASP